MKGKKYLLFLFTLIMIGCADKGTINIELNRGYSEFTIESKHKVVKSVDLSLEGASSCEVRMMVSKQEVDTIGTGVINFTKTYPWRAGAFRVKLYSPRCTEDEQIEVNYRFNK